jgi:hypothetical protein
MMDRRRFLQEAAAVHAGMVGRAANQVKCTARQEKRRPRASSSAGREGRSEG